MPGYLRYGLAALLTLAAFGFAHGAVEWALDHVMVAELIWVPTETQLRELLEDHLVGEPQPALSLVSTPDGYRSEIQFREETLVFEGFGVSEVYGTALLHIFENK